MGYELSRRVGVRRARRLESSADDEGRDCVALLRHVDRHTRGPMTDEVIWIDLSIGGVEGVQIAAVDIDETDGVPVPSSTAWIWSSKRVDLEALT